MSSSVEEASHSDDRDRQREEEVAAGIKRRLQQAGDSLNEQDEKKLRRLEKNRLSARECRRRKREATENVEQQIRQLEAENLRLKLQLQIGDEAEEKDLKAQTKLITEDIDQLLKSNAPESEIHAALDSFKEKHAEYGRDRRSSIEFHLKHIQRLLMPTQTTSVVMTAIQGGHQPGGNTPSKETTGLASANSAPLVESPASILSSEDGRSNMDPKALFQLLVNHLRVTPAQAAALKDSRFVAQELDECLDQALVVLGELRARLAKTGEDLEAEFANIRNILTPTQAAKFLVWVTNNKATVHMLNELWEATNKAPPPATSHNSNDTTTSTM